MKLRQSIHLIIATLFLILLVSNDAEGKVWSVRQDGSGDTSEIEDALNWADDGDSIDIGPGHFDVHNHYIGNEDLTIFGSGVDSTFINCNYDTSDYIFRIAGDNIVLSDFSVNDETFCRSFQVYNNAQNVEINNVKIYQVYSQSLYFYSDTKVTLKNSIIGVQGESIAGQGLSLYGNQCVIQNNVFYGNTIEVHGDNNQIKNNEISHTSDWSIQIYSENNIISGNTVTDSPLNNDNQGGSRETAFDYVVGTRTDAGINFGYTDGSFYGGQDSNYFGVIWEGSFFVDGDNNGSEDYVEFYFEANDGIRLTIDGNVHYDYLDCYGGYGRSFSEWMSYGSHTIKLEMLECSSDAYAYLEWYTTENEPLAFEGTYYDHSPPVSEEDSDFKSIYIGNEQNTIDATNSFENSGFVMYYQQDGKIVSGFNLGTKKVSNYNAKIYIRESSNIEIDDSTIGYPSRIEIYSSNSITIKNCDFDNGYLYLDGYNNVVGFNTFLSKIQIVGSSNNIHHNTMGSGNSGIDIDGDENTIADNQLEGSTNYALDIYGNNNMINGNQISNSGSWSIYNSYGSNNVFSGNTVSGSPAVGESETSFESIYISNLQNTVDETNSFEGSKFIVYYNQEEKVLSGMGMGSKKVSNYAYKIYISDSSNIEITGLTFNYPAYVFAQNSDSITIKNCDFVNGHLYLQGNKNIVEKNSFLTVLPEGNSYREIETSGDENTISENNVENGIDVQGDHNHIHNNTIKKGQGHGIYVPNSNNKIVYNEIKNATSNGIYSGGSYNLIDGNLVTSALSEALYIGSTTGTTVTERNIFKGSCVVLYSDLIRIKENKKVIENCNYSDLSGSIWNLEYYVSLRNSAWVSIDSLTYENIDKSKGIYIYESNNISINSVRITSKEKGSYDAVSIENSAYISISNSQFGDLNSGIDSHDNIYLDFESNTLTNCDYGITDWGSGDISIEGNTFRNSAFGVDLTNSVFFTVEDNELRNDRIREMLGFGVGIFVSNSIHGSVVNNDISGFDLAGIVYYTVSYLETENNKIYDNGVGVDLYEISPRVYLKIHNNDIYDNQQYGVYSDSPVDARFNWWGSPSGPYQRCESQEGCEGNVNIEGEGNPVNSNVDASEALYASGQGFTIVNSIQTIAYEYKFPIILILIVGIVGVIAWRRGWFEEWGDRTFAPPINTYPIAPVSVAPVSVKKSRAKPKTKTITIECTNCSKQIKLLDKSGKQKITCSSCGTSGEIEL